jgi:hypothetical protein
MEYLKNTVIKVGAGGGGRGWLFIKLFDSRGVLGSTLRHTCVALPAPRLANAQFTTPLALHHPAPRPNPQLFLTGEAEALLPVLASILSLSPEEVKACRDGIEAIQRSGGGDVPMAAAAAAVDSATSLLGGWSGGWGGWLGGGGGGAPASGGGEAPKG